MSTCTAAEIAEKRRIALEKLNAKKSIEKNNNIQNVNSAPSNSFYSSKYSFNNNKKCNSNTQPKAAENSFKAALNALKQSSKLQNFVRNHPYQNQQHNPKFQTTKSTPASNVAPIFEQTTKSSPGPAPKVAPVFLQTITCKTYLISQTRFALEMSNYHAKLIEVLKTIPSKSYDGKTRNWDFALKDYQLLLDRVDGMKPYVVVNTIPKKILDLCSSSPRQLDPSCLASIEPKLAEKLMPFQEEGVCFAIANHGCAMICDEMGLGKTYQALAIADFYKEDWPLLICTTASTRESWCAHIRDLLPSVPVHYIEVMSSNDQYINDAKVLIVSYKLLSATIDKLMGRKFRFLIFDESHQLKNPKSKCSEAANSLARIAKHVILLSGTPALSRPVELFTQLQMIDRKFMTFREFTLRYCDGKQTQFGWDASGQSNFQELNVLLKLKFMLRRIKKDVIPDMAEKTRETVVLDPALVGTTDDVKNTLNKLTNSKGREREDILIKFYAQTAVLKSRAVCAYLKTLLKEKKKFIVFAHHRVMMDAICECLDKSNVVFVRIDGKTKNETRAEFIKIFQTKSVCKVAVLSLRACNAGITLTAAELIIFAELDWNPSTLAQAESRAHRIGQVNPVVCRYLMANSTADDVIWNMLKHKQDVLNRAGLFSENLQTATHTIAPTISNKIEKYFSPEKSRINLEDELNNSTTVSPTEKPTSTAKIKPENIADQGCNEIENFDELFEDDNAFNDIVF